MCFAKDTPITIYDVIHQLENCMGILDDVIDIHPESHYLIISNFIMKQYHNHKDCSAKLAINFNGEQSKLDAMNLRGYEMYCNLEDEIKIGLVASRKRDLTDMDCLRVYDGVLDITEMTHWIETMGIKLPDGLDDKKHICDITGNVYDTMSIQYAMDHETSLPPLGFIHPRLHQYVPIPKKFHEELDWNIQITKIINHDCIDFD